MPSLACATLKSPLICCRSQIARATRNEDGIDPDLPQQGGSVDREILRQRIQVVKVPGFAQLVPGRAQEAQAGGDVALVVWKSLYQYKDQAPV